MSSSRRRRRRRRSCLDRCPRPVRRPRRPSRARRWPSAGRPRSCPPSARRRIADQLAAVDDRDPVGQLEDLVELGGDQQDRRPGVALGDRLAVDELDAPDIEPAGRLVEDEQPQVAGELAGDDDLLLVAARQRRRPARRRRRPDVEVLDPLLGGRLDRGVVAQDAARVRRPVVAGQDQVVGDRERAAPARSGGGRPGT